MRFSMILEMVDRLSAPARKARASVSSIGGSVRQMATQMRRAVTDVNNGTRSIEHFDRRARRLRQVALGRTFQAIGSSARNLGRDLDALVRRLRLVERGGKAAGVGLRKLGGMGLGMLKNGLLAGGAAAAGATGFALFDLFNTAGQFEQFQIMLEGTEGSAQAARKAMAWVTKFAETTPYELDQVMEAFVALKAYGIDPTNGSLMALGDASAGMSKPLMDAIEAMADAATGEFERLKSFGIRASKEGNRVSFSFRKDGKDIRRDAEFTGAAIEEALTGIFNERFGGAMIRQSTTMFGLIANLKDKWRQFLLLVAEAGIFDMVKKDLEGVLARVNELAKSGELKKWAEEVSDRLQNAWRWAKDFVQNTDWNRVADEVRRIADAVGVLADGILALRDAASWLNAGSSVDDFLGSVPSRINGLRGSLVPKSPGPAPGSPASRLPSDNDYVRRLQGKPTARATPQIGGALKIDISSAPGLSVRATPVPAPGRLLPLDVRTGRTMRSSS